MARMADYDLEGQIDRLAVVEAACSSSTTRPTGRRPRRSRRSRRPISPSLPPTGRRSRRLFPGRSLRAALLWTDGPRLMEIPSTLLDDAERRLLQRAGEP